MAADATRKRKKRVPGTRVLRDRTYEVILVVPEDCRERVGKKNLTRRLGTTRYADAARLAPPILREFERVIEAARSGDGASGEAIDPRKAVQAVDQWKLAELARSELRAFNQPDEEIPDAATRFAEYRDFVEHAFTRGIERLNSEQISSVYKSVETKVSCLKSVLSADRFQEALERCVKEELGKLIGIPDFKSWNAGTK